MLLPPKTVLFNPVELNGIHARLIPLQFQHLEDLFTAGIRSDIWTYMSIVVQSLDDMHRLVSEALQSYEKGAELPFVIIDQKTDSIVGSTRLLDLTPFHRNAEIGWTWLNPSVWRTPVNTECKYLLLCHCFETIGLMRVMLKTDARNFRSQSAIERLGGRKEGVLRKHRILPDGFIRDTVVYSIIREEWPEVKARLESFLLPREE